MIENVTIIFSGFVDIFRVLFFVPQPSCTLALLPAASVNTALGGRPLGLYTGQAGISRKECHPGTANH